MTYLEAIDSLFKLKIGEKVHVHRPLDGVRIVTTIRSRQVYHDRDGIHRTYTLFDGEGSANFPAEQIETQ